MVERPEADGEGTIGGTPHRSLPQLQSAAIPPHKFSAGADAYALDRDWQSSELCAQCQDVELETTPSRSSSEHRGLNTRGRADSTERFLSVSAGSQCPLCCFYRAVIFDPDFFYRAHRRYPDPSDLASDTGIQLSSNGILDSDAQEVSVGPAGSWYIGRIVPIERVATHESSDSTPSFGVHATKIDYKVVNKGIADCKQNHHILCREPQLDLPVDRLKLIDCVKKSTVVVQDPPNYIALSYVWGSPGTDSAQHNEALDPLQKACRVIRDAMRVTLELGFRYLWADQICIDQHDEQSKQEQLGHMDAIYNRASLTIVAAAGNNSSYGLPGVHERPRIARPQIKVNGTAWTVSTDQDLWDELHRSKWYTRGWTYQEGVFSRRCLIFTDYQVYFQCRRVECSESLDKLEYYFSDDPFNRINISNPSTFERSWLMKHIRAYSRRQLTYDEDVIKAFEGLFGFYARQDTPTEHYWGLPIRWNGYRDWESYQGDDEFAGAFLLGMLWFTDPYSSGTVARRTDFPTWSWAGWKTPIGGPEMVSHWDKWRLKSRPIHVETTNRGLVPFDGTFVETLVSGRSYKSMGYTSILQLSTEVIEAPFVEWKVYASRTLSSNLLQTDLGWFMLTHTVVRFAIVHEREHTEEHLVWPLTAIDPEADADRLSCQRGVMKIQCINITYDWGLIVQVTDGIAKRVGLVPLMGGVLKDRSESDESDDVIWSYSRPDLRDYFASTLKTIRLG